MSEHKLPQGRPPKYPFRTLKLDESFTVPFGDVDPYIVRGRVFASMSAFHKRVNNEVRLTAKFTPEGILVKRIV